MKHILTTIREFLTESLKDKIIFVRTNKFDNTGTQNKLPYNGRQCWAISESDMDKYQAELELWGGRSQDIEILNPDGLEIFAINYPQAHKYVMGETNQIPKLVPFNLDKHRLRFRKQPQKSMLEYVADMKYQIILIDNLKEDLDTQLTQKLISIGGESVKLGRDTEEELLRMILDGKVYTDPITFVSGGMVSQCHRNVADMWKKRERSGFKIVSGYALKEGVWLQHSWGCDSRGLIETTTARFDKYYGYELTTEESGEFCFYNY